MQRMAVTSVVFLPSIRIIMVDGGANREADETTDRI
jgi:hypothetical protein